MQGTYCIVETLLPRDELSVEKEQLQPADGNQPLGEQLCVLLGFRQGVYIKDVTQELILSGQQMTTVLTR